MNPNWWIAIVSWGIILGVMVTLSIRERRLTPEQKQAQQEKAEARLAAYRAKRKEPQESPSAGCLLTSLRTLFLCVAVMGTILLAVLILAIND